MLKDDWDKEFILDGVKNGFKIVDDTTKFVDVSCENYRSATTEFKAQTERQILTEITHGHYVFTDHKPKVVSALGAIPKSNSSDVRIIHDCSRPFGKSVNDFASLEKIKFQTLDEAARLVKPGAFMAKVDLKNAYRSVKIHPSNHDISGLAWKFENSSFKDFLVDTRLPFGARKAPSIFHRLTQAVRREMSRRGFKSIIVYLDDFLIISETKEECMMALRVLLSLLRSLGFQINWRKVEDPAQRMIFLGILLDSVEQTMELPREKLGELKHLLSSFTSRTRATRTQLQALAGKLNWACQAVRGGRTFLRRILDAQSTLSRPRHKLKLSSEFHEDIKWWLSFLESFNGKVIFPSPLSHFVHMDASTGGSGIYFAGDWLYTNWKQDWPQVSKLHINHKESLSTLLAANRWGHLWRNSNVVILTDNTTAKACINKMTSKNKTVMRALRTLFWLSVKFNFSLKAVHIPGKDHILPDAASRLHQKGHLHALDTLLGGTLSPPQLLHHMSFATFNLILLQIQNWWNWKLHSTGRYTAIGGPPSPCRRKSHTPPIVNVI